MGWAAIITGIMGVFGPLIGEALKKWLDGLLKRTAKKFTGGPEGDATADAAYILAAALAATPRRQPFRRALLRQMVAAAPQVAAGKLGTADAAELRALAGAAE